MKECDRLFQHQNNDLGAEEDGLIKPFLVPCSAYFWSDMTTIWLIFTESKLKSQIGLYTLVYCIPPNQIYNFHQTKSNDIKFICLFVESEPALLWVRDWLQY